MTIPSNVEAGRFAAKKIGESRVVNKQLTDE
jgi:hypothetical protein